MELKLQHPELYDLLIKKNRLVNDGRKLSQKIEDLEIQRNKCGLQIQKLKDRIIPLAKDLIADKLQEFEELEQIDVVEGNNHEIRIRYFNALEEFQKEYREQKVKHNDAAKDVVIPGADLAQGTPADQA